MQNFTLSYPAKLPEDAYGKTFAERSEVFEEYRFIPRRKRVWWPRFEQIALWMIGRERNFAR